MIKGKTLLFLVNDLGFFTSHRLPLALHAISRGLKVIVVYGELGRAHPGEYDKLGIKTFYLPMKRGGINPLQELVTFFRVWRLFRKSRPNIVHLITIKPYLYGGIVARLTDVPAVVSAVAGLGANFLHGHSSGRFFRYALFPLFRFAFGHSNQQVILQNSDDLRALLSWGVLSNKKSRLIRGSGVELNEFSSLAEPNGVPVICFAARLIRDKGVYDFVYAAQVLRERKIPARFWLAGDIDPQNPSTLSKHELQVIRDEGFVEVLGYQRDIPSLYARSHIICLPSFYGEGVPKALIEAAAASRAVVTTDHPGCRDAITPDVTGLLVPVRNPEKLADALQWLIEHPKERRLMGEAGRQLAEREFVIDKIIQAHWEIYQEIAEDNFSKNSHGVTL